MPAESFWLVCPHCGVRRPAGPSFFGCDQCHDAAGYPHWLEVAYDLNRVDRALPRGARRLNDYAPLLPIRDPQDLRTLGEGGTPLLRIDALNRELGLPNLYLKTETINPTGSFKDRLHAVSMTVARELGFSRAAIVTTGNSGVACAAYAARNSIRLTVITDPKAPMEHRRLMHCFGATIRVPETPGPVMPAARGLIETLVGKHGHYPCTALGTYGGPGNPYGVEGYKTIAFEIFGQLGRAPDRVCVPVSGGDALYGPFKGFRELRQLGLIETLPRMTACQATGANFAVRALRAGADALTPVEPHTIALSIGDPTGSQCILTALRESGGDAWDAPDDALLDAMRLLARHGLCVEAAAAAPVAALQRRRSADALDPAELIVAVLTGSGVRWPAQLAAAWGEPEITPARPPGFMDIP